MYQALAIQSLMSPAPNQTLRTSAATGDRIIQSMYESQATADGGAAVELSKCVYLSLDILNILLVRFTFFVCTRPKNNLSSILHKEANGVLFSI